ncbi:hypothetical protein AGOR_G00186670 [Albula goreensis]|uniref:Uncharacterized protein n=1 Tax=Albula goreensis TaxID=1534307 RepID=A0A8T3CZ05_9TELE|nr:hypothetical protein AGOR_G00186670 [Albula goreensis]
MKLWMSTKNCKQQKARFSEVKDTIWLLVSSNPPTPDLDPRDRVGAAPFTLKSFSEQRHQCCQNRHCQHCENCHGSGSLQLRREITGGLYL